jgi:ribosomal protein S4
VTNKSKSSLAYSRVDETLKTKFKTKEDLLDYYEQRTGKRELKSFVIPNLAELKQNLKAKQIQSKTGRSGVVDEYAYMTDWKRVFEH